MVLYSLNIQNRIYSENTQIVVEEIQEPNHSDIQKTIDNFNSQYTWDMMFTMEETELRMKYGDRLFLFYLNGVVVGHTWVSKKYLPEPHIYIYNVFVDKTKHNRELFDSTTYLSYYWIPYLKKVTVMSIFTWIVGIKKPKLFLREWALNNQIGLLSKMFKFNCINNLCS